MKTKISSSVWSYQYRAACAGLGLMLVSASPFPATAAEIATTDSETHGPGISLPNEPNWASGMPIDAIAAGREHNGKLLYVCRGYFNGGLHPGKTRRDWKGACHIGWGGKEQVLADAQVLVPAFEPGSGGSIPASAVPYGAEAGGQPIFICRAPYQGSLQPGKIEAGFDGCLIPYGGNELHIPNYEVLVNPQHLPLMLMSAGSQLPPSALVIGTDTDGTELYACVAPFNGGVHPGKTRADWGTCDVSWGGSEHWVAGYQVLVPELNNAPLNSQIQPFAAGQENSAPLGVCVANYDSSEQVGKLLPGGNCNFGYRHVEVTVSQGFQILSGPIN